VRDRYDAEQLAAELARLPLWTGDTARISRTVLLAAELDAVVRRRVMAVADEVDHHPVIEDVPGGSRYVLWTHVSDGVTELDIDLAGRIDTVLDQAVNEAL
jgi:4a-hydroxytetrahydrobiopterin dehydratase